MIVGIDLGGTRIRTALMDEHLRIVKRLETLTLADEGLEPTLGRIQDQIHKIVSDGETIQGIGISAPGPLNPETGVVVHPPNLPGWQDVPLGDILKDEFQTAVYVGNDANVAALAEAVRGAARGTRHSIYITVSTGIGSGIITDGRLLLGRDGLAAEAGHMVMIVGDRFSSLEEEAAGPDMAAQARRRIHMGESSLISELVQGKLDDITSKTIGDAALKGDALARSIVRHSGTVVGCGIVNLLHLFNPEIVIIGGGVMNLGDLILEPMHEAIEKYCIDRAYWRDLTITTPDLGEDVSVVGAAALVITKGGVEDIVEVARTLGKL